MLAAFSHSELKRRTSLSSATRSPRSLTRRENAPPASTEPSLGEVPQQENLGTGIFRGAHDLVEGEGPSQASLVDHDQLSRLEAPLVDRLVRLGDAGRGAWRRSGEFG